MKIKSSHLSNIGILFELGFSQVTENVSFILRKYLTYQVTFLTGGKIQLRLYTTHNPDETHRIWTCKNFCEVLNVLENFGVK